MVAGRGPDVGLCGSSVLEVESGQELVLDRVYDDCERQMDARHGVHSTDYSPTSVDLRAGGAPSQSVHEAYRARVLRGRVAARELPVVQR